MIKLHDSPLSGNAYKVRLLLSLLGIEYESVPGDHRAEGSRKTAFLALNPRGQIPVVEDDEIVVWDSQAILIYLARRYGGEDWLPLEPVPMAQVAQWLAVSENELLFGLARARAVKRFGRDFDLEACKKYGRGGLKVLDARLNDRSWLVGGGPTIADVACYPYVALAPEGEVALDDWSGVCAWLGRVQSLSGYVGMEGIAEYS